MRISLLILLSVVVSSLFSNNYDARYKLLKKEYIFNNEGGYILNYEHKLQFNTYHSFHRLYGETFIIYDPQYQTLKVTRNQTTMADGKLIIGPENALNEVLPSWAANSGEYNHIREMVVTHTGLEIGAISELSYTINSEKPTIGNVQIVEPLRINVPIDNLEIAFIVPNGVDFSISEKTNLPVPEIITETDKTIYKYSLTEVPAVETPSITDKSFIPHIIAQTGTESLSDLLQRITPPVEGEKSITIDDFDTVLDVQKEIVNIRTINVPVEIQLFPLQTPDITTKRNSGTPLEKAILFQKRLSDRGINSTILFKAPEALIDDCANIGAVTEIFLLFDVDKTPCALSPVYLHKNNPIDIQGYAYITKTSQGLQRVDRKSINKTTVNADLQLKYDKKQKQLSFSGTGEVTIGGAGNNFVVSKEYQPKASEIVSAKNAQIKNTKGKDLQSYSYELEFVDNTLKAVHNVYKVELPTTKPGINSWNLDLLNRNQANPLRLPYGLQQEEIYTINIPKGAIPITKEISEKRETTFGELELSLTYTQTQMVVTRKISIRSSLILPPDYEAFAEMYQLWNSDKTKEFYIEVK